MHARRDRDQRRLRCVTLNYPSGTGPIAGGQASRSAKAARRAGSPDYGRRCRRVCYTGKIQAGSSAQLIDEDVDDHEADEDDKNPERP